MAGTLSMAVFVMVVACSAYCAALYLTPVALPAVAAGASPSGPSIQVTSAPQHQSPPPPQQSHPLLVSHPDINKILAALQQHPAAKAAVAQAIANRGTYGRK